MKEFWKNYESTVHSVDSLLIEQRMRMYEIDYAFLKPFLRLKRSVLDVGCGNGDFLKLFEEDGFKCEGTEYGKEAFDMAIKKYKVYFGELADINLSSRYDVISLRGVIQYLLKPKESLKKAVDYLLEDGLLFITAVNADAICVDIFRENFRLPVTPMDYYMFRESSITEYLQENGMTLVTKGYLYMDTPYENHEEDIELVSKAIELKNEGMYIDFKSPPFFDNIMILIYRKGN